MPQEPSTTSGWRSRPHEQRRGLIEGLQRPTGKSAQDRALVDRTGPLPSQRHRRVIWRRFPAHAILARRHRRSPTPRDVDRRSSRRTSNYPMGCRSRACSVALRDPDGVVVERASPVPRDCSPLRAAVCVAWHHRAALFWGEARRTTRCVRGRLARTALLCPGIHPTPSPSEASTADRGPVLDGSARAPRVAGLFLAYSPPSIYAFLDATPLNAGTLPLWAADPEAAAIARTSTVDRSTRHRCCHVLAHGTSTTTSPASSPPPPRPAAVCAALHGGAARGVRRVVGPGTAVL